MSRSLVGPAIALLALIGPVALAAMQKPASKSGAAAKRAPAAGAAKSTGGTVEGTFTVNGKTVALKHVYALVKPDMFHPERDALYLYLTDVAVNDKALRDEFGLSEAARDGKLHGLEVKFTDEAEPISAQLYNDHFKDAASVSTSGMHRFVPRQFEPGKVIAGKLYVQPQTSFGEPWVYTATFSAPIITNPASKAKKAGSAAAKGKKAGAAPVEGEDAAALSSPPAEVARALMAAIQARDVERIKKAVTPEMAKELDGPQGPAAVELMAMMIGPKFQVTKVIMDGEDNAVVTVQNEEAHETINFPAVKINGEWKISRNE